ncbi:MAG TPA: hypothetical protein VGM90_15475 [Kofleriaceae bacterium]|jgi:hypothetical protein
MGSIEVQVIRISTPFSTTEQFVGTFRNYVTEDSCFIPSSQMKTVGVETGFSIRLADGTPVLRGLGVVLDSWATDENPWRKPGIRLGLRKLTKETKSIFEELQHARLARGSRNIIPSGEHAPLLREEPKPFVRSLRAESMSDAPAPIDTPATNAPVAISFFDATSDEDEAPATSGRPTRSMRVVDTGRDENPAGGADAWAADSCVPMEISEERENTTDRVEMTDLPQRSDVATLLGFAPLPKPQRASTERDRDTVLGMAPISIEPSSPSATAGLVAVGPIAIECMVVRDTTQMTAQELPMMAQIVSLPGLAHMWDPPELAALSALETTAIIERPHRRILTDWFSRLVWRVRAWYRTRSMR